MRQKRSRKHAQYSSIIGFDPSYLEHELAEAYARLREVEEQRERLAVEQAEWVQLKEAERSRLHRQLADTLAEERGWMARKAPL